jgi:hypothetical protein
MIGPVSRAPPRGRLITGHLGRQGDSDRLLVMLVAANIFR